MWRSETLLSIAVHPLFFQRLDKVVQGITSSLERALQDSFPVFFFLDGYFARLPEKIVKPAVNLAICIQTLPVRYSITPQLTFPPVKVQHILFPTVLDGTIARDIASRKTLSLHSNVIVDKNGRIGDRVMNRSLA